MVSMPELNQILYLQRCSPLLLLLMTLIGLHRGRHCVERAPLGGGFRNSSVKHLWDVHIFFLFSFFDYHAFPCDGL